MDLTKFASVPPSINFQESIGLPLRELRTAKTRPGRFRALDRVRGLGKTLRPALPSGLCMAGVILCTWIAFHLGQSFAFTGFVYLVPVVFAAMYGGFWQATLVSVAAAMCLNYFFIPPVFSFENSPENWIALGAFEFTALVISRLSLREQLRAKEAIAGRRDMERLYQTSRRMLLLDSSGEPGSLIPSLIREIFKLKGVMLFDALSGKTYRCGEVFRGMERLARAVNTLGTNTFDPEHRTRYCVLRLSNRPVGGLALSGAEISEPAASALASLAGVALEHFRALQRESRAQAARQAEELRTSVLDALAHQFKTPLTVARAASSGLLTAGGLTDLQAELVTVIDKQATKLDDLASRLLQAATLDSTDFKPQCEALLFSRVVDSAIQGLDQAADRDRFHVYAPSEEIPIFADGELVLTSVAQLLDNALKYSEPGSPIDVVIIVIDAEVVLTVRNKGVVISGKDRERVFERFYRAPETHDLPAGTGLGLSIVKRIVEAHQGNVWVKGETNYGTLFSISLPASRAC
jgi:two-component system, OmpR family, sensor histidine kinase KdpD